MGNCITNTETEVSCSQGYRACLTHKQYLENYVDKLKKQLIIYESVYNYKKTNNFPEEASSELKEKIIELSKYYFDELMILNLHERIITFNNLIVAEQVAEQDEIYELI
jgi:hypothetical protein